MRAFLISLCIATLAAAQASDPFKDAEKAFKKALVDQRMKDVVATVNALVSLNSRDAMKLLLSAAARGPAQDDPWWMDAYWTILNGAGSFSDAGAMTELADFIIKNKAHPTGRDAMSVVCNRGHRPILAVCARVLEAGPVDLKLMAADHLAGCGDKTSVEPLIKALKDNAKETGDLKRKIGRALTLLTGQDYGDSVSNWEGWWAANKDKELDAKKGPSAGTGTVTDDLDRARASEFERLQKTGKVLVLQAGTGCKCKKPHDLDHIDRVTNQMGLKTEYVTKADLDKKDDVKLDDYVAVLANCTHIREHCACPLCKPGNYATDRLFT